MKNLQWLPYQDKEQIWLKKLAPDQKMSKKMRMATWNVGSMVGRSFEVAETLCRRKVSVCCLQEVRWKGSSAKFIGAKGQRFKFWWEGSNGSGGVGVLIDEEMVKDVIEVRRKSSRILVVLFVCGRQVIRVISCYAPQAGLPEGEKEKFYDDLSSELSLVGKKEFLIVGGDFNGHIGADIDGYDGIHGGFSVGSRNREGIRLLDFCMQSGLVVTNTWFKSHRKETFHSGNVSSQIDFILTDKKWRKNVQNVKVIPGELQHSLVIIDLCGMSSPRKKKVNNRRVKIWRLKEDEVKHRFKERMDDLWNSSVKDDIWEKYKECVLQAMEEVCGISKGLARHGETWWWNEEVKKAVQEKKVCFKKWLSEKSSEANEAYKRSRRKAKKIVSKAMKDEAEKDLESLKKSNKGIFDKLRIMKKEARDIDECVCIKDREGKVHFDEAMRAKIWKGHMENIMNQENDWDGVVDAEKVAGPISEITVEEIRLALQNMKSGKAGGPSGVVKEQLIASRHGEEVLHHIANKILGRVSMPKDWMVSTLIPIYKGKGDVTECGSYRGVKLLEHGMKVVERVFEQRLRNIIKIDKMQFGFMPGKGTTDAIFIARRMQESYMEKKKKLYMCFVDLEKAFDRVPRPVIEWALRKRMVPENLVQSVMKLYENAQTRVKCGGVLSDGFGVAVGVHQGSVLSPLLFATVIDVLSETVKKDVMWNLLYADDLVLLAESMQQLERDFVNWKNTFESKGLKVNMAKTKVLEASGGETVVIDAKVDPCAICGKRVMRNSVQCRSCQKWMHARCMGVKRVTEKIAEKAICKNCHKIDKESGEETRGIDGCGCMTNIEKVDRFCYLGDTINSGGGCEVSVVRRCQFGWLKFNELSSLLCGNRFSMKIKGKIYKACVRTVMIYGAETWNVKSKEEEILRRAERAMIRKMCGVKLVERKNTKELMDRLGLSESIIEIVKRSNLRWLGHVLRRDDGEPLKKAWNVEVIGRRGRGRPKATWKDTVLRECQKVGLSIEEAIDRKRWKKGVKSWCERQ